MDEHIYAAVALIEAVDNQANNSTTEEDIRSFYVTLIQDAMNNSNETVRGEYGDLSFEAYCGMTDSIMQVFNCHLGPKV